MPGLFPSTSFPRGSQPAQAPRGSQSSRARVPPRLPSASDGGVSVRGGGSALLPGVAFLFSKPRGLGTKRGYLGAGRGGPEVKDKPRLEQANPLQASGAVERNIAEWLH